MKYWSESAIFSGSYRRDPSAWNIEDEGEADLKEREKEHARMLADIEAAKLELGML